ncbi:TPA: hypothetical protein NOS66_004866 [Pseudomonas aeruginosa]|nr:hypothetical protein [Pseudomonas aeruginosa]
MITSFILKVTFLANYPVVEGTALFYIKLPANPTYPKLFMAELKIFLANHLKEFHNCCNATYLDRVGIEVLAHGVDAIWEIDKLEDSIQGTFGGLSNVEIKTLLIINGEY